MASLSKRDIEMIFRAETDAAQRPVNELSSDVKKLRVSLEDLVKTSDKTDKSLEELARTTRDLEKAQEELGNARTLLTQLNSQAAALERAEAAAEKAGKKYNDLKAQVDGAEAPTKRLTNSLAAAERAFNANNAKLEQAKKEYAEVKGSIESIIGPVDNLQDAFRTVAVAQRDITQGLAAAKGSVAAFKTEIAGAAVEAERMAQVDAFRKMASDSVAAISAADRIKTATEGTIAPAQRLADAIQSIVNPAAAAANTIEGMDARLTAVLARMDGKKIGVAEWGHLNNELQAVQATLGQVAAEIDKFTAQQSRVDDAAKAYDLQAAKVKALGAAEIQASSGVEEMTADLAREEAALVKLGSQLDQETAKLNQFSASLKKVGVDSNNIPGAINRIEASAQRAAPAIQKVSNVLTPGGKKGFLGLDPFQLQNLSFQVNDVFTGLASGQKPLQILAQQGGQIVQIFPGILSSLARMLPLLAPLAIGFAVLAGSIGEANDQLTLLRQANATIAGLADNNGYSPEKFKQIAESFREIGVSAEDALKATQEFVKEGLNPDAVDDYVIAAKNLADVTGGTVVDAAKELTKAFTGNADSVLDLDDKYHFLTDTQRDALAVSKDTKDEYNQVNKAFTALYTKMQEAARAQRGPMTDSINTVRAAWRGLLQTFADTGILTWLSDKISSFITGLSYTINLAKRLGAVFSSASSKVNSLERGLLGPAALLFHLDFSGLGNAFGQAESDTLNQMAASQKALKQPQQNQIADAGLGSSQRQKLKEKKDEKDRKKAAADAKKAAREAEAEAKRRAREAAALAKQQANEVDQLQSGLSRATVDAMKGQQAGLEQQLDLAKQAVDEQFKALEDRLQEFGDKFGKGAKINGMSQEEFAAQLNRQKQQIVLNRQLAVYEGNINDLLKARDEQLKSIKEQQDAGLLSAQEALDKTKEVTSEMGPQIDAAIVSARKFIAALTPSAETKALLEKFDRIQAQSSGPEATQTVLRKQAQSGLTEEEQKVNDIFSKRAALIDAANKLYDIGAINFTDKEARIKAAYDSTSESLTTQIAKIKEYLEANKDLFPPEVFEKAMADLQAYNAELKYTNTLTQAVKQSAEQAISGGIVTMFDTLAQGIANVITGAGSLKDLFSDLGMAAINFAATFAKAIADAIIQIYALRIAKSLIGGFHGGGTVGDLGGGVMNLSRGISPFSLASVPRYHNGTQGAGLKSNEMLAVLEKGEKVQTEEQQHMEAQRLKAARSGKGDRGLRQVLAVGDSEIAAAMSGAAGEDVFLTFVQRNKATLKQMLGK